MVVIDFHTHILPPELVACRETYLQRDAWFRQLYAHPKARLATAEDLVAAMDAAGVDGAVAFGFAWADQALCRASNAYVLEAVQRWPTRITGFAVVNPVAPGALEEVERCTRAGLRGVGELMPDGQGCTLDDPRLDAFVAQVARWGLPLLVHAGEPVGHSYPGKAHSTVQAFYQLALRHPTATFVAAHWGGGLLFYELMPEVRAALKNVYYDTAASLYLYSNEVFPIAMQIVPHKVLFATDYPLIDPARFLNPVRSCGVTGEHLAALLGGNAVQLLGLTTSPPQEEC